VPLKGTQTWRLHTKLYKFACYCYFCAIGRKLMAESDDDDEVEEDDSDGDLETSRKLFFKNAKGNKKKKNQVVSTGT